METKPVVRLNKKATAAIALMNSGIVDLPYIARAVGLSLEEVTRIELADDPRVKAVAAQGIPEDFAYRLKEAIKCPRCGLRICIVPCLMCRINQMRRSWLRDRRKRFKLA